METQHGKRRVVPALLAALLAFAVAAGAMAPVYAVTQEEIDALMADADSLAQQKAALQEQISALSDSLSSAVEKKTLLDGEIAVISGEVSNLEEQIDACEEQIAGTEAELDAAREREAEQDARFRKRARAMEETGRSNYWLVLFRATSVSDLLSRLDFMYEIAEADQRVLDDLKAVQEEIAGRQAELEEQKAAVETARAGLVEKREELDREREAANQLMIELEAGKSEAEISLDDLSAEEDAVQEEILRLSRQLAEEEAAARLAAMGTMDAEDWGVGLTEYVEPGGYIWPVDSRRINSTFGGRASPGGIGSTNHKGVDIGGVGYGAVIRAAKAGRVIVSQYSSSYGNYVVISHGSGNTTLYAHMSQRAVSVGDSVAQGDILGTTGSTGRSTGPHLHFEIAENGVRLNPLYYLAGYELAG